jgi:hypothetical protein
MSCLHPVFPSWSCHSPLKPFTPLTNATDEKMVDEGLQQKVLPASWNAVTAKCCLGLTLSCAKMDAVIAVVRRPISSPGRDSSCQD